MADHLLDPARTGGAARAWQWVAAAIAIAISASVAPACAGSRVAEPRAENRKFDEDEASRVRRFESGVLIGTPSLINLQLGWWGHPKLGVRASGLYWGDGLSGYQGAFCYTVARGRHTRAALAAVAGSISTGRSVEWNYAGLATDVNAGAMFFEFGLVIGEGILHSGTDRTSLGIVAQLGLLGGGGIAGPR